MPRTLEIEDPNLWIDDDFGGTLNDQVFSDDFASPGVIPTYDDNGNLTFDGVHESERGVIGTCSATMPTAQSRPAGAAWVPSSCEQFSIYY